MDVKLNMLKWGFHFILTYCFRDFGIFPQKIWTLKNGHWTQSLRYLLELKYLLFDFFESKSILIGHTDYSDISLLEIVLYGILLNFIDNSDQISIYWSCTLIPNMYFIMSLPCYNKIKPISYIPWFGEIFFKIESWTIMK